MSFRTFCRAASLAALLSLAAGHALAQPRSRPANDGTFILNPEIQREGEGARRKDLNKMELTPFPAEAWGALSDWSNGTPMTAESAKGKVVLVVTYASWYRPANRAFERARDLASKYAKDGLVVLAAHDKDGFADAEKPNPADGVTLVIANDTKGDFRKAIKADQDPNFYLIDKAGQLRFADVSPDGLEGAIKLLVAETQAAAEGINKRLDDEWLEADRRARRSRDASTSIDMTAIPELPYTRPSDESYEGADWPEPAMTDQERDEFRRSGKKPDPKSLSMPEEGWIPKTPPRNGRVHLVLFFHPDLISAPRWLDAVNFLNDMQRRGGRDLTIALAVSNLQEGSNEQNPTKIETDPEKLTARMKDFCKIHDVEFSFVMDIDNALFNGVRPQNNGQPVVGGLFAIVSTDDTIRYYGDMTQFGQGIARLDRIINTDPGVKVRRAAEAKWLAEKRK